ncbi:MAG: DUF554 domain-containing protein [Coriobacteriia bacterium]|nr:DUF554 domain-containing protein [Coriobacteriia bacterium]
MLGVLINILSIIVGGVLGKFIGGFFSEKVRTLVFQSLALAIIVLGIVMSYDGLKAMEASQIGAYATVILVIVLVLGVILGHLLKLEESFDSFARFLEKTFIKDKSHKDENIEQVSFVEALIQSTIILSVGAMAIVGSMQSGIGDTTIIDLKSALDFPTAFFLAATMGWGVVFSSIPTFIYQGLLALLGIAISAYLSPAMLAGFNACGGVMILGIGINMLGIKEINVLSMLPSFLIIPLVAMFFGA